MTSKILRYIQTVIDSDTPNLPLNVNFISDFGMYGQNYHTSNLLENKYTKMHQFSQYEQQILQSCHMVQHHPINPLDTTINPHEFTSLFKNTRELTSTLPHTFHVGH